MRSRKLSAVQLEMLSSISAYGDPLAHFAGVPSRGCCKTALSLQRRGLCVREFDAFDRVHVWRLTALGDVALSVGR